MLVCYLSHIPYIIYLNIVTLTVKLFETNVLLE